MTSRSLSLVSMAVVLMEKKIISNSDFKVFYISIPYAGSFGSESLSNYWAFMVVIKVINAHKLKIIKNLIISGNFF